MSLPADPPLVSPLDAATRALVRVAAAITGGSETAQRAALAAAHPVTPAAWVEELLLQTYLFAGFPRALNATREWRRLAPLPAAYASGAPDEAHHTHASTWEVRGESTCALVYGEAYDRLRANIAALHPVLDHWMIVDGYGKILSRPGLDLARRELCIVAACAATGQDRQLLSHLHGALHAGASAALVSEALAAIADLLPDSAAVSVPLLWERVQHRHVTSPSPQPLS